MKIKPIWLDGHGYVSQREEYLAKRDTGFESKTVDGIKQFLTLFFTIIPGVQTREYRSSLTGRNEAPWVVRIGNWYIKFYHILNDRANVKIWYAGTILHRENKIFEGRSRNGKVTIFYQDVENDDFLTEIIGGPVYTAEELERVNNKNKSDIERFIAALKRKYAPLLTKED